MLGDGIRRNISSLTLEEQKLFRDAFIKLHEQYHFPDNVSGWFKQDQIHQKTHVHGGPSFLPWHRELCNQLEALLRMVEPGISLHYWDFHQNPIEINLLGTDGLFGASEGMVGPPLDILHNKGIEEGSRGVRDPDDSTAPPQDPTLPPREILRGVGLFETKFPFAISDEEIIHTGDIFNGQPVENQYHYSVFSLGLERVHNLAHDYIGGSIRSDHRAFEDPFVFLLHSNIDRLWAKWQLQTGKEWRLNPEEIYGIAATERITENMEPWAGGTVHSEQKMRPWGIDEGWPTILKNSKHPSIVSTIPQYDR